MKELSIEEKARAYDEAWHKAKRIINVCVDDNTECRSMIACIQQIFPELKESESERIKKTLIDYFKTYKKQEECGIKTFFGIPTDNILAWLEKQGEQILANSAKTCKDEQKPTDEDMKEALRTEYEKGRADAITEFQKAWSEEDERMFERILQQFMIANNDCKLHNASFTYDKEISFLKSLRPQNTWKPTDEQMKALHDINLTGNISYAGQGQTLVELYNDLKRLLKI